jgi:hypothetical protein
MHVPAWTVLAMLLAGCVTDEDKKAAINAVNEAFKVDYERILAEKGTRLFKVHRSEAFTAMRVSMAGLRMKTENQDESLGHLVLAAPAPLPLDTQEWRRVSDIDLPVLKRIIEPYVGAIPTVFVHFEPQGLEVVIGATFLEVEGGTEVSLTVRLREVSPPPSGWPRRSYLSPTVLNTGLKKIWDAYDQELRAGPQRSGG